MIIRGERVFTANVRRTSVAKCLQAAKGLEADARRYHKMAATLAKVTTVEGLQKIEQTLVHHDVISLRDYCYDDRKKCHYCDRFGHGGVSGLMLSDRVRFCCWRTVCGRKYERDVVMDEKKHPKLYVADRRRVAKIRRNNMRLGSGRLRCPLRSR